jgi:hypothetical protein
MDGYMITPYNVYEQVSLSLEVGNERKTLHLPPFASF